MGVFQHFKTLGNVPTKLLATCQWIIVLLPKGQSFVHVLPPSLPLDRKQSPCDRELTINSSVCAPILVAAQKHSQNSDKNNHQQGEK